MNNIIYKVENLIKVLKLRADNTNDSTEYTQVMSQVIELTILLDEMRSI